MFFRSNALPTAALVLALSLAMTGCGDTNTIAPKPAAPSTVPVLSAPIATPSAIAVPPPQIDAPETGIKQDAAKYPQDTPEKAFESIAKALEANDLAYQIAWLSTPDFTQRMLDKYKSVDAAVAANQGDDKVKGRQVMLKTIREMQTAKLTTQGEVHGVKWFCYRLGDNQLIQLERQKDGRWCMNPKVRQKL